MFFVFTAIVVTFAFFANEKPATGALGVVFTAFIVTLLLPGEDHFKVWAGCSMVLGIPLMEGITKEWRKTE